MSAPSVDAAGHYALIAAAIRFLDANAARQPSLAELAAHVGLSAFHLQRVFGEWAGISPKRFLQYLTKEHAKSLLRQRVNVFDASLASGLSGPGRLHDLLVCCDAVTPGELGATGEGLEIVWGVAATPFGAALIAETARGVCRIDFAAAAGSDALKSEWPGATLVRNDCAAEACAARVFTGSDAGRPLPVLLKGTNFQIQVWQALLRVPPGSLTTYGALASAIGRPGAARAVGAAVGDNALAVLIPCHRVIRACGETGGYRWGSERKRALIARETAQFIAGLPRE